MALSAARIAKPFDAPNVPKLICNLVYMSVGNLVWFGVMLTRIVFILIESATVRQKARPQLASRLVLF